jgi:glutathione S-transferase
MAYSAFSDLAILLGERDYFFKDSPSLIDAALFSYLYLIKDALSKTSDSRLLNVSGSFDNINRHFSRMKDYLQRISNS